MRPLLAQRSAIPPLTRRAGIIPRLAILSQPQTIFVGP
jgi:hypothetical protein